MILGGPLYVALLVAGFGLAPAPEAVATAEPAAPESAPATPAAAIPLEPIPAPAVEPPIRTPKMTVEINAELISEAGSASVGGPPYATAADEALLRGRHDLAGPLPEAARRVRWRCLIADPTCTFNVEINATSAYALRFRQGEPTSTEDLYRWSSGRSQFDLWVNLPAAIETRGNRRFTRVSLGPKGGVILSDAKTIWGNAGLALRYWFGRGRFAPTFELSSGLTYRLANADVRGDGQLRSQRSPIGVTMDFGVGLGGFGALIAGFQYDSPLAREDVPVEGRIYPGGMVFFGFRGNIVWGAPAALAVGTTALSQRVTAPVQRP